MLRVSCKGIPGRKSRKVFPRCGTRASPVWWHDMQMLLVSQGDNFAGFTIDPGNDPTSAAMACASPGP